MFAQDVRKLPGKQGREHENGNILNAKQGVNEWKQRHGNQENAEVPQYFSSRSRSLAHDKNACNTRVFPKGKAFCFFSPQYLMAHLFEPKQKQKGNQQSPETH